MTDRTTTTERDLLAIAGTLLALVTQVRAAESEPREVRHHALERAAICSVMRGAVNPLEDVPAACFSSAERLLAYACARVGRTPHGTRLALATAPRLELPLDAWAALLRGAELELDLASVRRPHPRALSRLLAASRNRVALARLIPAVEALARGRPLRSTAEALRGVAEMFEGQAAADVEAA